MHAVCIGAGQLQRYYKARLLQPKRWGLGQALVLIQLCGGEQQVSCPHTEFRAFQGEGKVGGSGTWRGKGGPVGRAA